MTDIRFLNRESILANKPKTGHVEIPEWGEGASVRIRELGSADAIIIKGLSGPDQNAKIAARVMIDEEGKQLFDHDNPEDVEFLSRTKAKIIERICLAAMNLSGVTEEQIQEAVKNSEASLSTDSVSA